MCDMSCLLTCSPTTSSPYQMDHSVLQWTSQHLLLAWVAEPGTVEEPLESEQLTPPPFGAILSISSQITWKGNIGIIHQMSMYQSDNRDRRLRSCF